MIAEYETCPKCGVPRVVGYYEGNVYASVRSNCRCMNELGRRFTPPGMLDRIRRRDARNVIVEIRPAMYLWA